MVFLNFHFFTGFSVYSCTWNWSNIYFEIWLIYSIIDFIHLLTLLSLFCFLSCIFTSISMSIISKALCHIIHKLAFILATVSPNESFAPFFQIFGDFVSKIFSTRPELQICINFWNFAQIAYYLQHCMFPGHMNFQQHWEAVLLGKWSWDQYLQTFFSE